MSISTFAELKSSIADFLNRSDLTTVIPSFISLAEAQINRDVRHWRMDKITTINANAGVAETVLPENYLETNSVAWAFDGGHLKSLNFVTNKVFAERKYNAQGTLGTPEIYSFKNNANVPAHFIQILPAPSSNGFVTIDYMERVPALSDSTTTNWLLSEAPDIYLYGSLLHAAPYLQDDERINVWAQLYGAAVKQLNESSEKGKFSPDSLGMRKLGLDTSRSKRANHVRWS
jgi:hypothetical protein